MQESFEAEPGAILLNGEVRTDWKTAWPEIRTRIISRPRLLLALGFDGVLSPIASRPSEATIPGTTRDLLIQLSKSAKNTIAILSGRSLSDIQSRIQIPNAFFVGNHGMEICGPGLKSADGLAGNCRSDLVDALAFLTRHATRLPGVYIEDKNLSVTAHCRMANEESGKALRELLQIFVLGHPRLRVFAGEACWELRARAAWNYGDAVRQILTRLQLQGHDAVYLGGEHADEDAFLELSSGLTFSVGDIFRATAQFHIAHPMDAQDLLGRIIEATAQVAPRL